MFDCHVHTAFSTDSHMGIEDAVKKSKELGLGIIITEHMDLLYPDSGKFHFKVDDYFNSYGKYRSDDLLLGMEMGMRPDCLEENRDLHNKYPFDYIIGSVHVVNGVDIYEEGFYQGRDKGASYGEYFKYMLECVREYDFIDSLGHIDYIARYARVENDDKEVYYREYRDYIDEILGVLAKNSKAIEINTRRLGNKSTNENLIEIYNRFRELGGKYVTIGSDAHNPDDMGKNFKDAREIAEICGLKIVNFKERKMILSK